VVSALGGGSDSHKALMWDRWRQGESLNQMARLFDRHHSSVRGVLVETGGMQQWSPEQIAGWPKRTYPDDPSCQVSHKTIHRTLFIQSRGALKNERPRKTLDFQTPIERYQQAVAFSMNILHSSLY